MAEQYQVIAGDGLEPGYTKEEVRENLSTLFKVPEVKIQQTFFTGKARIIKKDIDHETALKYQAALKKAGIVCHIRMSHGRQTEPARSQKAPPVRKDSTPSRTERPEETGKADLQSPELQNLRKQILVALKRVIPQKGIHVAPDIPPRKLATARQSCRFPSHDRVLGLVDCTALGSAKNCLVIGMKGLYFHNPWETNPQRGMISYSELPRRKIQVLNKYNIALGNNEFLNCTTAPCPAGVITALLQGIQSLVTGVIPDQNTSQPSRNETRTQEDRIMAVLRNAMPQVGLYVSPDIPAKKLNNAKRACEIPPSVSILGLVDSTMFGSAKDCLVFGEDAIYFHNGFEVKPACGVIPYAGFSERVFQAVDKGIIDFGNNEHFSCAASLCPIHVIVGLLQQIGKITGSESTEQEAPLNSLLLPICPRCGSTNLTLGDKGFSWGTALTTTLFTGPLGGYIAGSIYENEPVFSCQMCGNKWPASTDELRKLDEYMQKKS